jgi:hypothetical protein
MGPESIILSVQGGGREGTYSFVCPVCTEDVEKQADRKIVALLVSAGVSVAGGGQETPPAPAVEMLAELDGLPPLDLDDLIAFHDLLQDDTALDRFLAQG